MFIVYLTTYATVTSAPATEPAVAPAKTKEPFRENGRWPSSIYPAFPYGFIQDENPSYLYPYPQMPYYDDPRSRFYYPQTAVNGYPQYGYQIPSVYPYRTGYQYPNGYY